jgi:prefoldin subunit 5
MGKLLDKFTKTIKGIDVEVAELEKKAENVLNVFKSTVEELSEVNKTIDDNIATVDTHIKSLTDTSARLAKNKEANQKVIDKINEFLS